MKSYRKSNGATTLDDFDVHGGMNNAEDMSQLYLGPDGKTPLRAQGYQIVSPGFDGEYGTGGVYTDGSEFSGVRRVEADNIANFSDGKMGKK